MSIYDAVKAGDVGSYSPEAIKNYGAKLHPVARDMIMLIGDYQVKRNALPPGKGAAIINRELGKDICKLVKKHIGINITRFHPVEYPDIINAWADVPIVDKNSPIFSGVDVSDYKSMGVYLVGKDDKSKVGWVDNNKVEVHGLFRDIEFSGGITTGSLMRLSPGAVSAIILHEVGHMWQVLEYLSGSVVRNVALLAACQDLKNNWDVVDKVVLEKELGRHDDFKDFNLKESLKSEEAMVSMFSVVLSDGVWRNTGDLKDSSYSATNMEASADQFSTRLGLGEFYSEMIEMDDYTSSKFFNYTTAIAADIGVVLFSLVVTVGVLPLSIIIAMLWIKAKEDMRALCKYDTLSDRLERVKGEMISALKSSEVPEERKMLVDKISLLNETISKYTTFETANGPLTKLVRSVWPSLVKDINKKQLQQSYERLINNDLYASADKFKYINA